MANFGIFKGFSDKLFEGELPTQLGTIGSNGFLLDFFPNAATAYSLRRLRFSYTGSAIRVRRSSDNTEQDIGFDIAGGLDTTSITSFCGSGNGFVTTWYDQSGNGRNITQTTASNQPRIVTSGSIIINKTLPSVQFGLSGATTFLTATFNLSNPIRSFSYFNPTETNGFIFDGLTVNQYRLFTATSTTITAYANGANSEPTYTDVAGITNKNYLSDFLADAANTRWQINNNTALTANWGNTSITGFRIGNAGNGSFRYAGFLSEFVMYPSNQNDNANGIKANINSYYGIY